MYRELPLAAYPAHRSHVADAPLVSENGSSGFRVGETDRGAPLGEAAVTVQAHAVTCLARDGGGDGRPSASRR